MKTMFISCIVAILLCLPVAARGATDKSLLFYFMFDEEENGTVFDASDYGNDGIVKGDPKLVAGRFGTAMELDGAGDTIEIPHNDGLNITTAVTMEMWIKFDGVGGDSNQAGIEKGLWEAGEYSLYPVYGGGTLVQFNDLPDGCDDEATSRDIRDGEWHYLVGVWDGKEIIVYIDGEATRTLACEGELATNVKSVYIGSRNGAERFLMATVDEVRLYNRALTLDEIEIDMVTSGLAVSPGDKMAISWGKIKQGY